MDLTTDPRWTRFNDRTTPCPCCGKVMGGVYDIGFDHPGPWQHGNRAASGEEVLTHGEDALSSDFCVIEGQIFLRCVLPIPIKGTDEVFSFGPWGSVSNDSAKAYAAAEKDPDGAAFDGCFSWLSNHLPTAEMDDFLPCDLRPHEDSTKRPQLFVHSGHPLAEWQAEGITFDHLLDIYAAAGNDLRPHLADA